MDFFIVFFLFRRLQVPCLGVGGGDEGGRGGGGDSTIAIFILTLATI